MVKVETIGFKKLEGLLKQAPERLRNRIGQRIQFAGEQFRDQAVKDAPADVGKLRQQISKKELSKTSCEVVSGSKYSAPMEFGTKKNFRSIEGIDSSGFVGQPTGTWREFIENITNWVKRKGIAGTYSVKTKRRTGNKKTQAQQNRQVAYLIARKIYRDGVKPHPFFFKQIGPVRRDLFRGIREDLKDFV